MNIFEILSSGHGNISETNISAFLGYLLNPKGDHGLKDEFLKLFLEPLGEKYFTNHPKSDLRNLLTKSNYSVEVYLEKPFSPPSVKPQRIDVVLKVSEKLPIDGFAKSLLDNPKPLALILIENKINDFSFTQNQLILQQTAVKEFILNNNEIDNSIELYFIYITTGTDKYTGSFKNSIDILINKEAINGVHYCWSLENESKKEKKYNGIVVEMIKKMLQKELEVVIDPIVKETLVAFASYIQSNFTSKRIRNNSYDEEVIFQAILKKRENHFDLIKTWLDILTEEFPSLHFRMADNGKTDEISFPFEEGGNAVAFQIFFKQKGVRIQLKNAFVNAADLQENNWIHDSKTNNGRNWYKKVDVASEIDLNDINIVKQTIANAIKIRCTT